MSAIEFADTNVIVYAVGKESTKQAIARQIVADGVTVSAQVVNETVNVLLRKQGTGISNRSRNRRKPTRLGGCYASERANDKEGYTNIEKIWFLTLGQPDSCRCIAGQLHGFVFRRYAAWSNH